MDLWVVAAAAGAGYLANFWQNTLKEGGALSEKASSDYTDEKSEFVRPFDQQTARKRAESGSHLFRRLIRRQAVEGLFFDGDERRLEASCSGILPEKAGPGDSLDGDKFVRSEEYVRNDGSLLSLQPWIFRKESYQEDGEKMTEIRGHPDICDYDMDQYADALQPPLSPRNIGPVYGFRRSKGPLRSRKIHKYSVKPLSSTENCLIPQLYKNNIDFEECVCGPFPSPSSQPVRPFLVTDGKRNISRSTFGSFSGQSDGGLQQHVNLIMNRGVIGIPPLQASRKSKRKCEEAQHGMQDNNDSQHCSKMSQLPEMLDRVVFFCLGLSIGVMSSVLSNKREVKKLNDLLMHSENLVQDLQEELELKNSLVVRELDDEVCGEQEHHDNFSDIDDQDYLPPKCDSKFSSPMQKATLDPPIFSRADEKKESLSIIEAELEAELERLELNMNASSLEGRISGLAEVDPGLIGNVVHGELREDILNGKSQGQADSDGDTNGSSTTPHMANYCVSPRELSLRLHEIIQSQLEERIKGLETALYHSKRQLHFMEAEKANSQGGFSSSDLGTSSNHGSPILMDQGQEIVHPLCVNLSGDALDAYNEAYEEFLGITKTEEENLSSTTNMGGQIDGDDELCSSDQSLSYGPEVGMANETSNSLIFGRETTWKHIASAGSGVLSSEAYGADEVEDDETDDDKEGRMLIQQIVARTRQGSPLVINAQKIFSLWTNN